MSGIDGAALREQLGHPVIDGDGHWVESLPVFLDFLRDEVGPERSDGYVKRVTERRASWDVLTPEQRRRSRPTRPVWWTHPTHTRDRATVMLPSLLAERLPEFGIDHAIVYPSLGLGLFRQTDDDLRRGAMRALNRMAAEQFAPFADRLTPVAVIPTRTPDEAIEELDVAVGELGMRAILISGHSTRRVEHATGDTRDFAESYVDTIGLDSVYDYDPFWQKCVDLGVAVTDHGGSLLDSNRRRSPSNFVFNHVGHFAEAMGANAKAVFLGGVTQRFPSLPFAFLEGGVAYACSLLLDLESHWEKRNVAAMERNLRPTNIDGAAFLELWDRSAHGRMAGRGKDTLGTIEFNSPSVSLDELVEREVEAVDDFEAVDIGSAAELRSAFTRNFYFGCEPDDPLAFLAFHPGLGCNLKPVFGSDIGHFDVPVIAEALPEAWELVEHGFLTEDQFRAFTFNNIVDLHTSLNRDFFAGTTVAHAVDEHIDPRA
jgi:predicted TIM-barrel fold metal-dependent hydrolase